MKTDRPRLVALGDAIAQLQSSCGGEIELSHLLRCSCPTVAAYRNGRRCPSRMTCLQLARICAILDGPQTTRTLDYWMALARPETQATASQATPGEG